MNEKEMLDDLNFLQDTQEDKENKDEKEEKKHHPDATHIQKNTEDESHQTFITNTSHSNPNRKFRKSTNLEEQRTTSMVEANFEELMVFINGLDKTISDTLKNQENKYLYSFKSVIATFAKELQLMKEKHLNEKMKMKDSQLLGNLHKQLKFHKTEIERLINENQLLKTQIKEIKGKYDYICSEQKFEHDLLLKCNYENKILQAKIDEISEKLEEEKKKNNSSSRILKNKSNSSRELTNENNLFNSIYKILQLNPNFEEAASVLAKIFDEEIKEKSNQVNYLEDKNKLLKLRYDNSANIQKEYQKDKELHEFFKSCIKQMELKIFRRRCNQESLKLNRRSVSANEESKKKAYSNFQENNYKNFTSEDKTNLLESLFTNREFIKLFETKLFGLKCCRNEDCLYNMSKSEKDQIVFTNIDEKIYQILERNMYIKFLILRTTPLSQADAETYQEYKKPFENISFTNKFSQMSTKYYFNQSTNYNEKNFTKNKSFNRTNHSSSLPFRKEKYMKEEFIKHTQTKYNEKLLTERRNSKDLKKSTKKLKRLSKELKIKGPKIAIEGKPAEFSFYDVNEKE